MSFCLGKLSRNGLLNCDNDALLRVLHRVFEIRQLGLEVGVFRHFDIEFHALVVNDILALHEQDRRRALFRAQFFTQRDFELRPFVITSYILRYAFQRNVSSSGNINRSS